MNKERRRGRHRVDAIESNFECLGDILVRRLVEADMAIADLQKAEISSRSKDDPAFATSARVLEARTPPLMVQSTPVPATPCI